MCKDMKTLKIFVGAMLMACIPFAANAQFFFGGGNRPNQDSLRKIAAADYADMLAKVGVGGQLGDSERYNQAAILLGHLYAKAGNYMEAYDRLLNQVDTASLSEALRVEYLMALYDFSRDLAG